MRRLTKSQYRNSIVDILNIEPIGVEELSSDKSLSLGGFVSIGARRLGVSPSDVEKLEQASYDTAKKALIDNPARASLINCTPQQASDSCVQGFVKKYARLFYRRAATATETARLTSTIQSVANISDIWTGLSYGLAAMLQSPHFLYRVELGEAQDNSQWLRYTGYERATRLSFLFTNSTPDSELLDAAESGALNTRQGLLDHANRLAKSPRFEDTLTTFFSEQLHLDDVRTMVKSASVLDPKLPELMHQEVELLVRDWIWNKQRPISELMLSEQTFVNKELAKFYGMPAPQGDGFVAQNRNSNDPRVGLLGTAGILAVHSGFADTSATMRGRYIVQQLLCQQIPEPPPGVEVTLAPLPEGVVLTLRERVNLHLTEPSCAGCHRAMDPVGLPLEHFDAGGRYRENDHGLAIDVSGSLGGINFDGLRGLAATLASNPRVDACMVEQFYSYALGHELGYSDDDDKAIYDLQQAYNGDFSDLVKTLIQHDAFLLASGTASPAVASSSSSSSSPAVASSSPTIEAEKFDGASPASPFAVQADGNRTIVVWPGQGATNAAPADNVAGQLFYTLIPSTANLTLYATVNFASGDDDSIHYKLDGAGNWATINNAGTVGYKEILVGTWNNLTPGKAYTLKIQRREDGAKLDSFRVDGGNFTF
ncbi:MAG: DUF1592 domain-containing protein [Marinagarivorans sp.]|nr:DUF1592 domain-containing protein [Marinagarivorans sp.]